MPRVTSLGSRRGGTGRRILSSSSTKVRVLLLCLAVTVIVALLCAKSNNSYSYSYSTDFLSATSELKDSLSKQEVSDGNTNTNTNLNAVPQEKRIVVEQEVADTNRNTNRNTDTNTNTTNIVLLKEDEPETETKKPIAIAYAISLIKCGDFQSTTAGLSDAALVLRHSLHKTSVRTPASGSKYDYKMYAIVHEQAAKCSTVLSDAGFEVLVVPPPILASEIQGDFLRKNIHKEWCCGSAEFVKLYAYNHTMLNTHPVIVHVDLDFAFFKPMDDLFDAMIYDKESDLGKAARDRIPLERPSDPWPEQVQAFMTRDWPQVMPGRKAAYQAGFLVTRPDPAVFQLMIDTVRKGDYVDGYGRDNGWGGKGR
jgi:hypothetical protein